MKEDKGRIFVETRRPIPGRNGATKRCAYSRASALSQLDITLDRVCPAIDFGDTIIKPTRTFPRIAHSINRLRAANFRDQRTAQETLKIQRKRGLQPAGLLQPREQAPWRAEAAKFTSRKNVDVVYIRIAAQQRHEFRVNHPRDLGVRMRIANQRDRRKRVDDVAERTRLDDQDRFSVQVFGFQASGIQTSTFGKPLARQAEVCVTVVSSLIFQWRGAPPTAAASQL